MRAVLRGACAVALIALWATSAGAGPAITASIDAPGDGDVLTGVVDVAASASSAAGVKRIEISIDSFGVASRQPTTYQPDADVGYSWDTRNALDSSAIAPNGRHTITVRAVATGGADDRSSIEIETNNPPVSPDDLSVAPSATGISLTWAANPEPDLIGYVVERDAGSGFVVVGQVEANAFEESLVAGRYLYRVTAVRFSPVETDGIKSPPSAPVSFTVSSAGSDAGGPVTRLRGSNPLARGRGLPRSARGPASSLAALLGGTALPSAGELPAIPSPAGVQWGSYEPQLPYEEVPATAPGLRSRPVSASGPFSVVPPDGLRWVAAGLLLLVCAGLFQVVAVGSVDVPRPLLEASASLKSWFTSPGPGGPRGWRRPH
jgi:hypothetical protein